MEETRMTINEYQELAMTTLNPELISKREILITQLSHQQNWHKQLIFQLKF